MKTFGTDTDNLIDAELSYGASNYTMLLYHNGIKKDIYVEKLTIHFVGSKIPFGNITKHYLELQTNYMDFIEGDELRIDVEKNSVVKQAGTFYITSISKGEYDASYTAFTSLIEPEKIALHKIDEEPEYRVAWNTGAKTIKEIINAFLAPAGLFMAVEPEYEGRFVSYFADFENMSLGQMISFCGCLEGCNYVLEGNTFYPVYTSVETDKTYNIDDVVYTEDIYQKQSDAVLGNVKLSYKRWEYENSTSEDPMLGYIVSFVQESSSYGSGSSGFDVTCPLIPVNSNDMKETILKSIAKYIGMDFNSYTVSFLGDARPEIGDKLTFQNADKTVSFNVSELIWEWDGGLKCTVKTGSGAQAENSETSMSINEIVSNLKAISNQLSNVAYNAVFTHKLDAEVAALGYASIKKLETEVAKMGLLTAEQADIKYLTAVSADLKYATADSLNAAEAKISRLETEAVTTGNLSAKVADLGYLKTNDADIRYASIDMANVSKAAIGTVLADVGLITEATITNGHVTGYLNSVSVNANDITAGTLSVDRLVIRGTEKSLVYELNNITGALQSKVTDTLNGEILTKRTITADKIVAKAITANELAVNSVTAEKIAANAVTADKIAANSITAVKINAGAITTEKIAANAITSSKINVSALSAITANLGTVTAGIIKSANYTAGTSGMKLDLSTGVLDSKNTKLDKEGKLTCSNIVITGGNIKLRGDSATAFVDISHDTVSHTYNARMDYNGFRFSDANQQTSMSVNLNALGLSFNGIQVIENPGQAYPNIKNVQDVKTWDNISLRGMHSDYLSKTGGTMSGTLQNNRSVIVKGCSDYGQFISDQGSYRIIQRNDGASFYILIGSPGGAWNALRPFVIDLATGNVIMSHNLQAGGIINNPYNAVARTTAAPNCYIDSTGSFYKSSGSSRKFKYDFSTDFNDDLDPEKLYDIKVYQYKFKKEYMKKKEDSRYGKDVIGLVAEQVYEHYPVAADYTRDENGVITVNDWNFRYLIPAMLKLLQDQKKEIETLKTLIEEGDK